MRDAIEQLPASRIREVANAGLGRSDVLAFWFGESDEFTRKAVRQAASESLLGGETFYSQPRPGRVARGLVGVHDGAAPSGGARAHRGHRVGRVGADAGDADAAQCRERGRGRGATEPALCEARSIEMTWLIPAEYFSDVKGWVPVDISEAWKAPEKKEFLFGHLDADRVGISLGRDITFAGQQGPPLNYFVFPYAEIDGKPVAVQTKVAWAEKK